MSYPIKYPFTLTRSNQARTGATESEVTFEGFATYYEDEDTQCSTWEVEAYVTGFTQYRDGKVVSRVSGVKLKDWAMSDLKAFENDCVDRACFEYKLRMTKQAA